MLLLKNKKKTQYLVDKSQLDIFICGLQLSIQTCIISYKNDENSDTLHIKFNLKPIGDKKFEYFKKIVDGEWKEKSTSLLIKNFSQQFTSTLLNFLMLTRLQDQNIKALVALDSKYSSYLDVIWQ